MKVLLLCMNPPALAEGLQPRNWAVQLGLETPQYTTFCRKLAPDYVRICWAAHVAAGHQKVRKGASTVLVVSRGLLK